MTSHNYDANMITENNFHNSLPCILYTLAIKQVSLKCISPPDSSGDEEAIKRKRTKRLITLQRAREIKKKKKENVNI